MPVDLEAVDHARGHGPVRGGGVVLAALHVAHAGLVRGPRLVVGRGLVGAGRAPQHGGELPAGHDVLRPEVRAAGIPAHEPVFRRGGHGRPVVEGVIHVGEGVRRLGLLERGVRGGKLGLRPIKRLPCRIHLPDFLVLRGDPALQHALVLVDGYGLLPVLNVVGKRLCMAVCVQGPLRIYRISGDHIRLADDVLVILEGGADCIRPAALRNSLFLRVPEVKRVGSTPSKTRPAPKRLHVGVILIRVRPVRVKHSESHVVEPDLERIQSLRRADFVALLHIGDARKHVGNARRVGLLAPAREVLNCPSRPPQQRIAIKRGQGAGRPHILEEGERPIRKLLPSRRRFRISGVVSRLRRRHRRLRIHDTLARGDHTGIGASERLCGRGKQARKRPLRLASLVRLQPIVRLRLGRQCRQRQGQCQRHGNQNMRCCVLLHARSPIPSFPSSQPRTAGASDAISFS